jgi:hypothetical protein
VAFALASECIIIIVEAEGGASSWGGKMYLYDNMLRHLHNERAIATQRRVFTLLVWEGEGGRGENK